MQTSKKARSLSPRSTLPTLPKKYKRDEARLDGEVAQWLVKNHPHKNWLLEVKMKGGKHLPHQKAARRHVTDGTFLWKPPDMGARMPGDYIYLGDADAIVCTIDKATVTCNVNDGVWTFSFRLGRKNRQ